eukprot:CAMPEP_0119555428 /NCGR_PEP_ID=MMETSP1352-20130426/7646_1 /TAXON_ID=265584 /ORGANISM="Stauroneis constricta, Strain CCMP1120" /LENGTH=421 /DNA_ID=CAMNT_0007602187 /DNA_START=65 /DNA_END=1330 /DNA_ORIENTATION=-
MKNLLTLAVLAVAASLSNHVAAFTMSDVCEDTRLLYATTHYDDVYDDKDCTCDFNDMIVICWLQESSKPCTGRDCAVRRELFQFSRYGSFVEFKITCNQCPSQRECTFAVDCAIVFFDSDKRADLCQLAEFPPNSDEFEVCTSCNICTDEFGRPGVSYFCPEFSRETTGCDVSDASAYHPFEIEVTAPPTKSPAKAPSEEEEKKRSAAGGDSGDDGSAVGVAVGVTIAVLLCCCCCIAGGGYLYWKRTHQDEQPGAKEEDDPETAPGDGTAADTGVTKPTNMTGEVVVKNQANGTEEDHSQITSGSSIANTVPPSPSPPSLLSSMGMPSHAATHLVQGSPPDVETVHSGISGGGMSHPGTVASSAKKGTIRSSSQTVISETGQKTTTTERFNGDGTKTTTIETIEADGTSTMLETTEDVDE